MVASYTPVVGTFEFDGSVRHGAWFAGGPYEQYMRARGFEPLDPSDPFVWSSDVNGWQFWRRLPGVRLPPRADHVDWIAGGSALRWRQSRYAYRQRGIVAYSHAGQLVAEACSKGLRIPFLITIATPVRDDMTEQWKLARPNIGYWLHLRASVFDPWMFFGSLGDGPLSGSQDMEEADANRGVKTMRHGRILTDPRQFDHWESEGWLDLIRSYMLSLDDEGATA